MMTRRIRLTRVVREEVELTVHYLSGIKVYSFDNNEDLFRVARESGKQLNVCESFEVLSQFGYQHPEGVPADITVTSDGIIASDRTITAP